MTLASPLSERDRANLRLQAHRHALLLTGALDALPPDRAASASASLRQVAVVLETLADDERLHREQLNGMHKRQLHQLRLAVAGAWALAILALLV